MTVPEPTYATLVLPSSATLDELLPSLGLCAGTVHAFRRSADDPEYYDLVLRFATESDARVFRRCFPRTIVLAESEEAGHD